jgi:hypothetical protein
MKNTLLKTNHIVYLIMIVFTFITCKKEDTEDMAFGAGDWSGQAQTYLLK